MGNAPRPAPSSGLEEYFFFADESLGGKRVPSGLRDLGLRVETLREVFAERYRKPGKESGVPDTEWLKYCGDKSRIVLTKDKHIRTRFMELRQVERHKVRLFVLSSGNMSADAMVAAFKKGIPKMRVILRKHDAPFIAMIYKGGRVEVLNLARAKRTEGPSTQADS